MGTQPIPVIVYAAQAAETMWAIPASIQLAQWALESGWGKHMPVGSNNPFGIKAIPGQSSVSVPTREFIAGRYVTVNAAFAAYPDLTAAFDAHAELLACRPQYAPARACLPGIKGFCDALTGVYATDPNYGTELMAIIDGSDLTQYDKQPPPEAA